MRRKSDTPTPRITPGLNPSHKPSLTPRPERFCHAFVYYANAAHAAREAGYTPRSSNKQGYRLLKTSRIRARIREIQAQLSRDNCRDMDVLLGKLENVYRRAVEDHHFYAAARAVELQAKLAGMTAAKRLPPVMNPGDTPAPPLRAVPSGAPVPE